MKQELDLEERLKNSRDYWRIHLWISRICAAVSIPMLQYVASLRLPANKILTEHELNQVSLLPFLILVTGIVSAGYLGMWEHRHDEEKIRAEVEEEQKMSL